MKMLGKRTHPMIGRLSELMVSGHRPKFLDAGSSPRSPLDTKIQSPRGLKNYNIGGVGLGIVAALEKSSEGEHDIMAKYVICSPRSNRSDPIPVYSGKNCNRFHGGFEEMEESLENYTQVTRRGPNKCCTKVYYNDVEYRINERGNSGGVSVLKELPARISDDVPVYPTSDFLSSCHLCRKKLDGKDIYMYRGEKGFCSAECRSRQIMMDERKEQCRSQVPKSADVSSSAYTTSPIFSTGILAI